MDLYLVGGFLGSGKTTAIVGAARLLAARGRRVGIVTNDQGRHLVDTAFVTGAGLPAVEVGGGCFCCGYDRLDEQLDHLRDTAHPDAIFAEAVGSCADVIATVWRPLRRFRQDLTPAALTVFADIRLLRRHLRGEDLPFSTDVQYVFDAQLAEAGLLVINKADLLPAAEAEAVVALARVRLPDTPILLLSGREAAGAAAWLETLAQLPPIDRATPRIDYARYGIGERRLAWLDAELAFTSRDGAADAAALAAAYALAEALRAAGIAVGHLKFLARAADGVETRLSLTGGGEMLALHSTHDSTPRAQAASRVGEALLVINARAEAEADLLRELALRVAHAEAERHGARLDERTVDAFHPREPRPTHWMGEA